MIEGVGWFLFVLALVGGLYTLASSFAVRQLLSRPDATEGWTPPVTVLKPLCGDEVGLEARLHQLCNQDYRGPVQIVFGVRDARDAAVPVVNRIVADYPHLDIALVTDDRVHGSNLKISNLINMERLARYEVLVVADSDVSVTPDYLAKLMASLAPVEVGYATCVYFGVPTGNIWSRLSAMSVNHHLLPSIALGLRLKMAKPCFGPTMAFRRDVLERAGGLRAFVDRLADDFEIGHAIRELGYTFAISPAPIGHACPETTIRSVFNHELRWARTIRLIDPAGYAGTAICHPFFLALLGVACWGASPASLALLGLVTASRLILIAQVERLSGEQLSGERLGRWWLAPARDLLSAAVFIASFMGRTVVWRGRKLRIAPGGDLMTLRRPRPWGRRAPGVFGVLGLQNRAAAPAAQQRMLP